MSLAREPVGLFFPFFPYSNPAPCFVLMQFPVIHPMQCWLLHNLWSDAYPRDGIDVELNGWYGALNEI